MILHWIKGQLLKTIHLRFLWHTHNLLCLLRLLASSFLSYHSRSSVSISPCLLPPPHPVWTLFFTSFFSLDPHYSFCLPFSCTLSSTDLHSSSLQFTISSASIIVYEDSCLTRCQPVRGKQKVAHGQYLMRCHLMDIEVSHVARH